jgi:hypothetical protein
LAIKTAYFKQNVYILGVTYIGISPTEHLFKGEASLRDVIIMRIIPPLFRRIYDTPACIALIPSLAVIIDYTLTFFLASDTSMVLQWEASPIVRFAVAHNIMAFYLPAIAIFYFCAAFAILAILHPTRFYRYSVVLVLLVSVTHVLGGLSWYFRVSWYSNGIMILSAGSVIFAFCLFGYSLIHQKRLPAKSS